MLSRTLLPAGKQLPSQLHQQARALSLSVHGIKSYFAKDVHYPYPPPAPVASNPYPTSSSPSLSARSSGSVDPYIVPSTDLDGRTFFCGTDALSSYNTAATPLPIWHKGVEYSERFESLTGKGEGGKVPSLWNIEQSWELWDGDMRERVRLHLEDLSKGDWKKMTIHEKKAAWYVNYGPWGSRAPALKHGDGHWYFYRACWIIGAGFILYNLYGASIKRDRTMTNEYQRKLNHKYRAQGYEAVPGLLDPNYGGTGVIVGTGTPFSNERRVF